MRANGRDLPWRRTRDPYAILVSEVMLQQTQVDRVVPRYERWLERWPTVEALAAATTAEVILEWQGLGYNRRAVSLHRAARAVAERGLAGRPDRTARRRPVHRGRGRQLRVRPRRAARRHERPPRAGAHGRELRRRVRAGAVRPRRDRLPRARAALRRVPARERCPSRGRRYEPLRKQSPFEGSFRQRRARRAACRRGRERSPDDAEAIASLARDGLVTLAGGVASLPA